MKEIGGVNFSTRPLFLLAPHSPNGIPVNSDTFVPPPPFIPLSSAAIPAQIGLLRAFYRERMRVQSKRLKRSEDGTVEKEVPPQTTNEVVGALSDAGQPSLAVSGDGGSGKIEGEDGNQTVVVLEDEEQPKQKYKVPPAGKLPRRAMCGVHEIGAFDDDSELLGGPANTEIFRGVGRGKGRGRGRGGGRKKKVVD